MKTTLRLALLAAMLAVPLLNSSPASAASACPTPTARRWEQIRTNVQALCAEDIITVGTLTLAGNPTMLANGMAFGTTGILFEGPTADGIEGLLTAADPTSTDKTWTLPNLTGTVALVGTAVTNTGDYAISGRYSSTVQAVTVADDAAGTKPASTLTPSSGVVTLACNDSDGATITLSETGAIAGSVVRIVSIGSGNCEFADTSGVTELAGAFVAGATDVLTLVYVNSAWHEVARSNN